MKKLNIKKYKIEVGDSEKLKEAEAKGITLEKMPMKEIDLNVAESISNLLFNMGHGGREFLKDGKLSRKLEECKEDYILLENEEYERITKAADKFENWSKNFLELADRIYEAEEVKIKENK